jgi:hypothetical protein
LKHFLMMIAFAAITGLVFGIVQRETRREQFVYGVKVFLEFVVVGLALGWILYFIPW